MSKPLLRRFRSLLLAGAALGVLILFPIADGQVVPAHAQGQVSVSIDFRSALEPYGTWRRHSRWGEVWVPARRTQNWRPYQTGHWVYTEEWGWYWISDNDEAEWGWVTYHYGRWVFDARDGWLWLPGEEWGPAWVDWRRGDDFVGWAPLPPDEIIVETREDPQFWVFVRPRDLVAPRVYVVFLPPQQRTVYFQRTVIVNSTVVIDNRGQRIAVNPGIPPAYIAAASRRPLPTFQVRPRVFAGTRGVEGAVEIRAEDLRGRGGPGSRGRDRPRTSEVAVQRTSTVIQPAASVPTPEPLGRGEKGRLGSTPPRAAQGASQPTPPQPPAAPTQQGQPGVQPPASTPGATPPPASAPPGATTSPPPTPGTTAPPSPPPASPPPRVTTPPASTPGAAPPAVTRPTQPSGERPATPTGERPATSPTPPPSQSAPRTEPSPPTTPRSVPAEKTPPLKATPEAPRGERPVTPPPTQSAPRPEQPSRQTTPPPTQSAPRPEQPSRPATPPSQSAPAQQSPPAATSAPPPKSTAPAQREKSE